MARKDDELAKTAIAPSAKSSPSSEDAAFTRTAAAPPVTAAPSQPDELALTRTAAADASTPGATPSSRAGRQLGRLRLERELGSGGMGSVHAAFDPDLERRVAVKLLHARSADARARLLREARAMAKLSHPNVIAVYDVGTVDGEDFVAMELIDGETLGEWRARAHPPWREIVAAFVQAGRGLAAAHAGDLVHRDFKPSNALRAKTGRVVVTDFGLSRAAAASDDDAALTAAPVASGAGSTGPVTMTATGALLGTPAYMAPEQWTGKPVSAATDQFAFCVALAEALSGERPYRGDSLDQVRAGALAGPGTLDGVPGAVRAIVRRGLAVDPAARWPSMPALLDALERALGQRRRRWTLAAALAVGAAGVTGLVVANHGRSAAPPGPSSIDDPCGPAAIDPGAVAARAASTDVHDLLAGELAAWRTTREAACNARGTNLSAKLSCLDGALARVDLVARLAAAQPVPGPSGVEGASMLLVDSRLCGRDPAPHLIVPIGPPLAHAFANVRRAAAGLPLDPAAPSGDPCVSAMEIHASISAVDMAALSAPALSELGRDAARFMAASSRCTADDAIRVSGQLSGIHSSAAFVERGESAIAAMPQADYEAQISLAYGLLREASQPAEALASIERAIEQFGARHRPRSQIMGVIAMQDLLLARGATADLARVRELAARWRPGAAADDERELHQRDARARWRLGDVAGADADLLALGHVPSHVTVDPPTYLPLHRVAGIVVDERGLPVADADVAAADVIDADSQTNASLLTAHRPVRARTGADGRFEISAAAGLLGAWDASRRSVFAQGGEDVRLVLHPTVRVSGRVALHGADAGTIVVTIERPDPVTPWDEIAPVRADGTFVAEHVIPGSLKLLARPYGISLGGVPTNVAVTADRADVELTAQPARPLRVLARASGIEPPDMTLLFAGRGHSPSRPHATLRDVGRQLFDRQTALTPLFDALPEAVRRVAQPEDQLGVFVDRPPGPWFVCAAGFAMQMFGMLGGQSMAAAYGDTEIGCADVRPDDDVVVVDVPPMRKPKAPSPSPAK